MRERHEIATCIAVLLAAAAFGVMIGSLIANW